jgi:hypothetical protein
MFAATTMIRVTIMPAEVMAAVVIADIEDTP